MQEESGLTLSENGELRIVFGEQQTTVKQKGLSIKPGISAYFLIASDMGIKYSFEVDLDQDVQMTSEVRHPSGEKLMSGREHTLDWRSSRTIRGDFRVILTNEGNTTITYSVTITRTLPAANQLKLDNLLAKCIARSISVEHAYSVQWPTIFDKLYGQEIATQEVLHFDYPRQRVDVYIFANEKVAQEVARIIEPGANYLVQGTNREKLYITNGSIPLWWQDGPFLLYTTGPDVDLEQKLTTVLGDPLGATTPDSVNIRISNRTNNTLTNVRLWSDTDERVFVELWSGVSGYHSLAMEDTFAVAAEYEGQISTTEMAALPPGDYTLDILATNNHQLLFRFFNDRNFYIATNLIDQNWLWQYTDLADG